MVIENMEIKHECSPEHLCMVTVRLKSDKETDEDCKQQNRVKIERSRVGKKKNEVSTAYTAGITVAWPTAPCYPKQCAAP